mgnify:CR=1 FL=1
MRASAGTTELQCNICNRSDGRQETRQTYIKSDSQRIILLRLLVVEDEQDEFFETDGTISVQIGLLHHLCYITLGHLHF